MRLVNFACQSPYNHRNDDNYCGTYVDINPRMTSPLTVKVENKFGSSFKVQRVERTYEVSTDGASVKVSEFVELKHNGPFMKDDDFNRADLNRLVRSTMRDGVPVTVQLALKTPKVNQYFRIEDGLGLNWNYMKQYNDKLKSTIYNFQPRFPILSGWKYSFTYSYITSLDQFRIDNAVRFPVTDLIYNTQVESVAVRIILPEDARFKNVNGHQGRLRVSKSRNFLSTLGRTVLSVDFFSINPVIQSHAAVTLELEIPVWARLRKPLLGLVASIAIIILISKIVKVDPVESEISELLDKRKQLMMNGASLCKIDAELLALCSSNSLNLAKFKQALDTQIDCTQVDTLHSNLLLSIFE